MKKLIIGIDEAGRGPLAGPVTVGLFAAPLLLTRWILKNIFNNKLRDSKKLAAEERVAIYRYIVKLRKENKIFFSVSHVSNKVIDKIGISKAVEKAINNNFKKLGAGAFDIRLDGLLKAPAEYKNQKTIIKGDEKDIFIACASICAKVSRDRLMCRLAKKYPKYSLEVHKGYGTKLHRDLIKKNGLSLLHRKTYCKNLNSVI